MTSVFELFSDDEKSGIILTPLHINISQNNYEIQLNVAVKEAATCEFLHSFENLTKFKKFILD